MRSQLFTVKRSGATSPALIDQQDIARLACIGQIFHELPSKVRRRVARTADQFHPRIVQDGPLQGGHDHDAQADHACRRIPPHFGYANLRALEWLGDARQNTRLQGDALRRVIRLPAIGTAAHERRSQCQAR